AEKTLRAAALESQFGRYLIPAFALGPNQRVCIDLHIVEEHLIEMLAASKIADWPNGDARQLKIDDELRHAFVTRRLFFTGEHQGDHVVRVLRVGRPDLLPIEQPAGVITHS